MHEVWDKLPWRLVYPLQSFNTYSEKNKLNTSWGEMEKQWLKWHCYLSRCFGVQLELVESGRNFLPLHRTILVNTFREHIFPEASGIYY